MMAKKKDIIELVDQKAEKEEVKVKKEEPEHPPYLKHVPTGRIYPYHPITAQRGDMIPYYKKE